ncbi:FMN-dependent NADH-azoreductase [Frondihabitans sp. PhB188]|uniref:FMN-dependent NADH-azoreductase n=1 Tax=Frondihabitans sp. PhB188 TaxID=2485200 RepID=UPI000F47BC6F|nr:NAD(P)H-dependent oxidoreductase [Frondihabitans sp. PhB188]ROQ37284.1 FMN-dependent NADH-azoreductase [Frondihabitans sp. PhB188]
MPTLLHLDSSADIDGSRSRAVTKTFADAWAAQGDDHVVVYRDLHVDALPHLSDASLHFPPHLRPAGAAPSPEQEALQAEIIAQLLAADVLLIGVPLYNYSMPSTLKAWIDYIHVPSVTAPFGADTTQPMAGRPAVLVSTRGGVYDAGTPTAFDDHALPALQLILGTALGMRVETIVATRTLTERFGGPADEVAKQHAELDGAHEAAAAAAARLA